MIPTRFNPLGSPPYLRRVSYLGATGTQYINAGVTPGADFTAEITLQGTVSAGYRQGWQNNEFRITARNTAIDVMFANGGQAVTYDFSNYHTVKFGTDGKFYIDNVLISERSGTLTNFLPFYIFQFNNGGSGTAGGGTGKVSRAILKSGSATVRDLIPVMDKSGVPCMFDSVTEKLFYNAGTGTFNYA